MTTVRRIQLVANAGEPDSVLARRVDVVSAAVKLVERWCSATEEPTAIRELENNLVVAVRRYKGAIRRRS
jgi:hypothetical protein